MDIAVKAVESTDELRRVNALFASVHMDDPSVAGRWLETCGVSYPHFQREHTRIAFLGRELVGGLRLNTDTIRIGEARLRMGGLGWVTTVEHHRGKGICTRLMKDAVDYMRGHGYHLSMLFGIPGFYHRWDYVTSLADYVAVVDVAEACRFQNPYRVRMAKRGDIRAIQRLHNLCDTRTACSLLRTAAHISSKWDHEVRPHVLTDEQGKVLAYMYAETRDSHLAVLETGMLEPALCEALVATTANMAKREAVADIRFHGPPACAMARFLLGCRSRHETHLARNAGGMLALIDMAETLEMMIPEWEASLQRSAAAACRTEFTLFVKGVPYRVRTNRGAIDVARAAGKNKVSLTQADLVHLITGYRHPEDILFGERRLVSPDARDFFTTIFPKRTPYVWPFDRF